MIYKINISLNQLHRCMLKSGVVQRALGKENFEHVLRICKDTENVGEPNEKDLCAVRKDIETVKSLAAELDPNTDPTAVLYLERLLHCMQVSVWVSFSRRTRSWGRCTTTLNTSTSSTTSVHPPNPCASPNTTA